jgi:hypothetical protein
VLSVCVARTLDWPYFACRFCNRDSLLSVMQDKVVRSRTISLFETCAFVRSRVARIRSQTNRIEWARALSWIVDILQGTCTTQTPDQSLSLSLSLASSLFRSCFVHISQRSSSSFIVVRRGDSVSALACAANLPSRPQIEQRRRTQIQHSLIILFVRLLTNA